jgi:quinoprotein glucose dehydrogenase
MRLTAINLNAGTIAWTIPLGDGPRQRVIDMGIPDPGPLGGGAYTGPLVTRTLLFLGLRGNEAPDLVFGPARQIEKTTPSKLLVLDKRTGETVHSVGLDVSPTGTPMTYVADGKQYIVLAYGIGSAAGLIGLAVE